MSRSPVVNINVGECTCQVCTYASMKQSRIIKKLNVKIFIYKNYNFAAQKRIVILYVHTVSVKLCKSRL